MEDFRLRGLGIAMVTPFTSDGQVDYAALDRLVDRNLASQADYIVVLGTTAETPTLSAGERAAILSRVRERVAGATPLVAGIGGNCTASLCAELGHLDLKGFDAILSVVPFYNKPTQQGIIAHYRAVAEASPAPVIMYNVPGRTGVNMLPETTLRLASDCPNIVAVKEASGDIRQIARIIEERPKGFHVISGDDGITYELMRLGGEGVISVLGNALPNIFGRMVHLCAAGRWEEAEAINSRLHRFTSYLFAEGNPAGVKNAMHHLGLVNDVLRLPLCPVSPELSDKIKRELSLLGDD